MSALLTLFVNNLLPVFLIAGAGALLGSVSQIDPRTVSKLILYIFSPCLIFTLLTESQVSNEMFLRVVVYTFFSITVIGGICWIIGRLIKVERSTLSSMMLTSMFSNAGNYGLPVVLFAFGQTAMGYASLYFVMSVCLVYTVGTVIASMSRVGFSSAITNLIKLPLIYAVIVALIIINTGWELPLPALRAINLLGNASIPCMLILLGLQLRTAKLSGRIIPLTVTSTLKLVISPLLAFLLLPFFGLNGEAAKAIIIEAGMPTAVLTTMLATEFDSEPAFATAAVFITTLLSPLTLTTLLSFLGA